MIGSDFYAQADLNLNDDDRRRINVFDWEEEFKDAFAGGGFDAVVENAGYRFAATATKVDTLANIKTTYKDAINPTETPVGLSEEVYWDIA